MKHISPSRILGVLLLAGALDMAMPARAVAAPILLSSNGGLRIVDFLEPIGQSFTAEDAFVTAALSFGEINPASPADPLRYDFYEGNGTSGALLASTTFTLAAAFNGFFDFDLSAIPLTVGNMYSLVVVIPGTSSRWGINDTSINYAGGTGIAQGVPINLEFALRVVPTATPVPEPTSMLLLGSGLAGLAVKARRRRRA